MFKNSKTLFYYSVNGLKVHIHVHGSLENYTQSFIEKIKEIVAEIVGCSPEEIQVGEICPSDSFLVVLFLKTVYLKKLLTMEQQDKDKLSRLNIDYIIADLNVVFLERSKGTYRHLLNHLIRHYL